MDAGAGHGPARLDRAVNVWWVPNVHALAALGVHLDHAERHRAARFRHTVDRQRFLGRRGLLRAVLARHLGADASSIRLSYNRHGKPLLAHGDLQFNLSHSGDAMVLAVTRGGQLGIDIEWVRSGIDVASLATHVCTRRERALLAALPRARRIEAFLAFWVHKEAVAKADGRGLSLAPTDIDVTAAATRGRTRTVLPGAAGRDAVWHTTSLPVAPGLAVALATRDMSDRFVLHQVKHVSDIVLNVQTLELLTPPCAQSDHVVD